MELSRSNVHVQMTTLSKIVLSSSLIALFEAIWDLFNAGQFDQFIQMRN
jgi:hypothetical protein